VTGDGPNTLTDRAFWADHWRSKRENLLVPISSDYLFSRTLARLLPRKAGLEFVEIGGFPGFFSVFFRKYYQYNVTLFDRYIDRKIIAELSAINGLSEDIDVIEADLFEFETDKRFDVVMSSGFIEHFTDLRPVIEKHVRFLKQGGYLVVAMPNFLGLNGLVQRMFDRANYRLHNPEAMRFDVVLPLMRAAGIEVLQADYEGQFGVWIEQTRSRSYALRRGLELLSGGMSLVWPFETRIFSPYCLIVGRKS
jgi:SAM-dependent methyltransferase